MRMDKTAPKRDGEETGPKIFDGDGWVFGHPETGGKSRRIVDHLFPDAASCPVLTFGHPRQHRGYPGPSQRLEDVLDNAARELDPVFSADDDLASFGGLEIEDFLRGKRHDEYRYSVLEHLSSSHLWRGSVR